MDTIKTNPRRFFVAWTLQGLWVFSTGLPVFALNVVEGGTSSTSATPILDVVCLGAWALGFALEVVADSQKRRWQSIPANRGKFISAHLWKTSRHPNYAGRILSSWSLAAYCALGLHGSWALVVLGPLVETLLLLFVSGIPLLERHARAKWGAEYEEFARKTPILIPFLL